MEPLSDSADTCRKLDDGMKWHLYYAPERGRHHNWAQRLPLNAARLICMECHAEHTIADLETASHFCPVRLPMPSAL